ncbi:hypothetical protein K8I61_04940 [bacterium]|nr:hypothetical protein [bacterium]
MGYRDRVRCMRRSVFAGEQNLDLLRGLIAHRRSPFTINILTRTLAKKAASFWVPFFFVVFSQLPLASTAVFALAEEPFAAGAYFSYLATTPKALVYRCEVLDRVTHSPISGANIRLSGTVQDDLNPREYQLSAKTGGDGIAVFFLRWDAWKWAPGKDDVNAAQRIEVSHPEHQFFTSSSYKLSSLQRSNSSYDFPAGKADEGAWFDRMNPKMFFLSSSGSSSDLFNKVRNRDYGNSIRSLDASVQPGAKAGLFAVFEETIFMDPISTIRVIP